MLSTDRPTVVERYLTADTGSDVLTAAGWVAQRHTLALMLWSVMHGGQTSQKHRLAELLGDHLNRQMRRDRTLKGDAWKIAKEMLGWYCEGTCEPCEGRGYEVIAGTPTLSDRLCSHCHGSGKRAYTRDAAHVWMEAELGRMTAIAASELMKRLAKEMP